MEEEIGSEVVSGTADSCGCSQDGGQRELAFKVVAHQALAHLGELSQYVPCCLTKLQSVHVPAQRTTPL